MDRLKKTNADETTVEDSRFIKSPKLRLFLDWLKTIVIAVILALLITSVIKPTLVSGESMWPTFDDKDYLITFRLAYHFDPPKYGDVIVFNTDLPEDILIKRVIGAEGDKIKITGGKVYVNDTLLNEEYINLDEPNTLGDTELIVPEGKVFAMGDNRNHSLDSRYPQVGLVDSSQIIGKVILRIFPFNSISII